MLATRSEVLLPFAFMKLHQINLHKAHIESNQFSVSGFDKIIQQFDRSERGQCAALPCTQTHTEYLSVFFFSLFFWTPARKLLCGIGHFNIPLCH